MMRYAAPQHTTGIMLSVGPLAVDENGFLGAPNDLPESDHAGLRQNGFTPVMDEANAADAALVLDQPAPDTDD